MKQIQIYKMCIFIAGLAVILFASCESRQQKQARAEAEEEEEIKIEETANIEEKTNEKYIDNSLMTGETPYSDFYGRNPACDNYGCSQISVRTPSNSDVLVTIKQNDIVVRHAYIQANDSYTFEIPNGTYQPFFYYGKGWNPEKVMKETPKGTLKGGFVENEYFGKDDLQHLENNILQYELILQQNGNFNTKPSNVEDAL